MLSTDNKLEIKRQYEFPLIINGVSKLFDLYLKKTNNSSALIEFKCNIDMIEKDLFKFIYCKTESNKVLFIWEVFDHRKTASGNPSSYLKMLEYFERNKNIKYFYFPLLRDKKDKQDIPDEEITKESLMKKIDLTKPEQN